MGDRDVLITSRRWRRGSRVRENSECRESVTAPGVAWILPGTHASREAPRGDRMASPAAPHQVFISAPHRGRIPFFGSPS